MNVSYNADVKRLYFPGLDGLRTIAFLMVFICHTFPPAPPQGVNVPVLWWNAVVESGATGVPLFFCLSSFLITSLLLKEKERFGTIDVKAFYMRRVLRIWPLYFLVLGLGGFMWWLTDGSWMETARNHTATIPVDTTVLAKFAGFIGNFSNSAGNPRPFIGTLWSVCVEEQFYLVWPVAVYLLGRRGLTTLCGVLLAVGITFRVYTAMCAPASMWNHTLSHLDCFAYGCLVAMHLSKPTAKRFPLVLALCPIALVSIERFMPIHNGPESIAAALGYTATAAICAFIVWQVSLMKKGFLFSKPMIELGKLTYGCYCFHVLAIGVIWTWFFPVSDRLHMTPFAFVLTVLAAWLSFNFFEKPFLRLKDKLQKVASGSAIPEAPLAGVPVGAVREA